MSRENIAYVILALCFIAVFVIPVSLIGPIEFFSGVLDWPSESEFGSPAAGYMFLAYIFALPLLGGGLLIYVAIRSGRAFRQ